MKIGYGRVSTYEQNEDLQRDALEKAECERIFIDHISSTKWVRPELDKAKAALRPGDILVVWRLDRLGRSVKELIKMMEYFKEGDIQFISLKEHIDTTTPTGKFTFHLFAAFAELERDLIVERTMAGLEAARARGRHGGAPRKLSQQKVKQMISLYRTDKDNTVKDLCETYGISRSAFYDYVHRYNEIEAQQQDKKKEG